MQNDPNNLLLGAGRVYFDPFDKNGVRTGEIDLGEVSALGLSVENETAQKRSSRAPGREVVREVVTSRSATLALTADEYSPFNMALASMGRVGKLTQAAHTVTAEPLTAKVKLGRYFPTEYREVSEVTVHQGATELVAGTDYTVDTKRGRIYFLPDGGATEDSPATVDYTAAVIEGLETVAGATEDQIVGYMRFVGDPTAGPEMEAEFWKVSVKPNGEIPLIHENDFGSFQLNLTALSDRARHPDEPFYRVIRHGVR